jgi:hypothetical protein
LGAEAPKFGFVREAVLDPSADAKALLLEVGDGETRAALAAAVREDLAATRGCHARTETVGADAAEIVRLIRAFHGFSLLVGAVATKRLGLVLRQGGARKHPRGLPSRAPRALEGDSVHRAPSQPVNGAWVSSLRIWKYQVQKAHPLAYGAGR